MNRIGLLRAYSTVRNTLFGRVNREFLIFLFFLAISGIFWLMMTLNETYEKELSVEVRLANVPRNVVVTSDASDTVRFTVRDKGYMIASYIYSHEIRPLFVNFANYANGKGRCLVPITDVQRQINQQLYTSTKLVSVKASGVEFFYNFGRHKKVPVRMAGRVIPGANYYLAHVRFEPDSVTVYATKTILDSIHAMYTVPQQIKGFTQPTTLDVRMAHIQGAKAVPAVVQMKLIPDVLTEEIVQVSVEAINVPDDKVVRTFPSKVPVRFVIGANQLRRMPKDPATKQLLAEGFRVVINYRHIMSNISADKCHVYLVAVPNGVRGARLQVNEIDYLIEQR